MRIVIGKGNPPVADAIARALVPLGAAFDEAGGRGPLDALITTAPSIEGRSMAELDETALENAVERGVIATVELTRSVLGRLGPGSRIVHVAPCGPATGIGSIGASIVEAALVSLTRSTAAELAPRPVAVNAMLLRHCRHADDGFAATLRYLLAAPASVTGSSLAVPFFAGG